MTMHRSGSPAEAAAVTYRRIRAAATLPLLLVVATSIHPVPVVEAVAVCPAQKLLFFHVPKAGGASIKRMLLEKLGCMLKFNGITPLYFGAGSEGIQVDAAHPTPAELESYVAMGVGGWRGFARWSGGSRYGGYRGGGTSSGGAAPSSPVARNGSDARDAHGHGSSGMVRSAGGMGAPADVRSVLRDYHTFATVRNPYIRVLAAYDQRSREHYDAPWGTDYPKNDFVGFMRYLDNGLRSGRLSWCCSPTITHFRPSTLFTHHFDGRKALNTIIKLEEVDAALPEFLAPFLGGASDTKAGRTNQRVIHMNNQNPGSTSRVALCDGPRGCSGARDMAELLAKTPHTNETLEIVERIYADDFDWLGYDRLSGVDAGDQSEPSGGRNGATGTAEAAAAPRAEEDGAAAAEKERDARYQSQLREKDAAIDLRDREIQRLRLDVGALKATAAAAAATTGSGAGGGVVLEMGSDAMLAKAVATGLLLALYVMYSMLLRARTSPGYFLRACKNRLFRRCEEGRDE